MRCKLYLRTISHGVGGGHVSVLVGRMLRDPGCPRLREGFVGGADDDARVVSGGVGLRRGGGCSSRCESEASRSFGIPLNPPLAKRGLRGIGARG
jgi:hypothetical protein